MPDALYIGLSALKAQQRALEVTSHNIANSTTPGYSRQRVDLAAPVPENGNPGQIGRGIDVTAIRRMADVLTTERLRQSEGESSRLAFVRENLTIVQQAFNEPGDNGLAQITNQLFASFEDLSANPESAAVRSTAIQALDTWAGTVSSLAQRLEGVRADLQSALESDVKSINDLSASIAQLNQQIRSQVNLGNSPNDLLDRRESLLQELTGHVAVNVRTDPRDQSVAVDIDGHLLIGTDRADSLLVRSNADGDLSIISSYSGFAVEPTGGRLGAIVDLHKNVVPGIQDQLDTLSATVAKALNARQSVGTSNAFSAQSFTSDYTVPVGNSAYDLDDPRNLQSGEGQPGIPAAFAASFTDANGAVVARNLTLNVLDSATGLARKYTLRYGGSGTRSLDDLISAINTGKGGGFTLYPPGQAGIDGVTARKVQVDSGYHLEISSTVAGRSIDFSQALDNQPSASAWTGATVAIAGAAAIPAARLTVSVDPGGTTLRASYRDPASGATTSLGTAAVPAAGTAVVAIGGLTLTVNAGAYRAGDSFGIDLDGAGNVLDNTGVPGTFTRSAAWTAADSSVTIRGRYTGSLAFDPTQPWSMKVMTAGVVGAKSGTAPPNNPPQVQFTYWTGSAAAPTQQTVVKTLDETLPAGVPVEITDGVYAVFGSGSLSRVANQLDFTVDSQCDQAGLLPALGINNLLSGGERARTLAVSEVVSGDANRLALANSRNEGDNSNLAEMIAVRKKLLFSGGTFAMDDFYNALVAEVGSRIQQATRMGENQDSLKASLAGQRDQLSGVNIDEEVGAMILQQQAYSAAARIISSARENIQTLLDILR
jgi:flagellar hook-associated protein 1 FlgK